MRADTVMERRWASTGVIVRERGRAGGSEAVGWCGWGQGVPSGRSGRAASTGAPRGGCALPFPVCEIFVASNSVSSSDKGFQTLEN